MLNERPGCYIWMGSARTGGSNPMVHNPAFDFNDDALSIGASYWAGLVEYLLPKAG